MTVTAAFLIIISACMHASWNLFSKSLSPSLSFFLLASLGTTVGFSPIVILTKGLLLEISLPIWIILVTAGLFQAIYYTGLAGAYSRGALSITYPLARALPLLFVVTFTFFAGRGEELSLLAITGALTIVTGAFILPMDNFRDFKLANYLNSSCAFAVVAALGTAGYSFVDDIGMNLLKQIPNNVQVWMRAFLYLVVESFFTAVWLQLIILSTKKILADFKSNWRRLLLPAFLAGLAIGTTYGIILLAMTYATNISYVVGLRQLSIPIGAILGILILKERSSVPRFCGAGILFIGLVLISLG
jgi:drug/metabolite transporter (DMT)-like permease